MVMSFKAACDHNFRALGLTDPDKRRNHTQDQQSDSDSTDSDSEPPPDYMVTRFGLMIDELMREPTEEDLVAMAKAQVRDEWYTENGKAFYYRNMGE